MMGKFLVLCILIPVYFRFRFRKKPILKAKVFPWFWTFTAVLLLVMAPWNPSQEIVAQGVYLARLAIALALTVYLVLDIRKCARRN